MSINLRKDEKMYPNTLKSNVDNSRTEKDKTLFKSNKVKLLLVCFTCLLSSGIYWLTLEKPKVERELIKTQSSNSYWDNIPKPIGWVNDFEEIFTPEEERKLDSLIQDFEDRTTVEIAVITIPKAAVEVGKFEELTLRIAQTWGVGKKETNNGILIGISTGYRKIRIQNGLGIEKQMSNEQTKKVIDEVFIPNFKIGNYYTGTFNSIQAIKQILEKDSLNQRF